MNLFWINKKIGAAAWFLALAPALLADPIQLRPTQMLQAAGTTLGANMFSYTIPCATDWNGDGKKDLLVGYQIAGKIAVFTNSGKDDQPVFTNFFNLQYLDSTNGWKDIYHPSGGCGAPAPWVCDFDADGKRDLLVGAGHDGTVWFYRNTNTDASPTLISAGQLKVGPNILTVGVRAKPCVHDWNSDGLPDLICGSGDGYVFFYKNTNTVRAPVFDSPLKIQAGGTDLVLNTIQGGGTDSTARSAPVVVDWDGDGLKDLLCSSDNGVYWCRNTNNNSNPILLAPTPVSAPVAGVGLASIITGPVPGARMRVFAVDWNNDGVTDLLLGNANGTVYYYEGYRFAFTQIASQTDGKLLLKWNSAPFLKYHVLANGSPNNLQFRAATNLPSGGTTTTWTNAFEGNQQYYQIRIAE
jgi:hypothetical protein